MDPSTIGSTLSGMASGLLPAIMKWIGISLVIAIILGAFYFVFLFFQFNIAVNELIVGENSDSNKERKRLYIKGVRLLRARKVDIKGIPQFQYLFKKKPTDPIPDRFILPYHGLLVKSTSFVYNMDGEMKIPSAINFNINPHVAMSMTPLPFEVRRAASLELQQIAKEYQEDSFMAKYGNYFYGFLTVLFCLILTGAVIWMTYTYIGGELGQAAQAAQSMGESFREGMVQKFGS